MAFLSTVVVTGGASDWAEAYGHRFRHVLIRGVLYHGRLQRCRCLPELPDLSCPVSRAVHVDRRQPACKQLIACRQADI